MSATQLSQENRLTERLAAANAGVLLAAPLNFQQPVLRHIFVTRAGRGLLGGVQHSDQFWRKLRLARAPSTDFRLTGDFGVVLVRFNA